jgi:hypothetical protein
MLKFQIIMDKYQSRKSKNKSTNSNSNRRRGRRVHKCALCNKELINESYSDHYCQTGIEIEATSYLKKLLRKESVPRQNFPKVQHVWAEPHSDPKRQNCFVIKIKAPLDIIPDFIEELKAHLPPVPSHTPSSPRPSTPSHTPSSPRPSTPARHTSSPRPSTPARHTSSPRPSTPARQLLCSFYNSPDGCTNENCQRIHLEDPEEKKRLLNLKTIIEKSKVLNPAIKGYVELLNFIAEENFELLQAIQDNFDNNLRQPTERPGFEENLNYIRSSVGFGYELDDLRQELKMLSRRCYGNKNPKLLEQLQDLISFANERVQEMEKLQVSEEKIYLKSKAVYDAQNLSRCIYVI